MIDWNRASELREEIGEEDFGEVVDLFLEEVDAAIATLEPGMPDMEAQLHFLKGSALNLGFCAFSDLCQAGETAAANGEGDRVDVAQICAVYAASQAAFTAGLAQRSTGQE